METPDFESIGQINIPGKGRPYVYVLTYPDGHIFYVGKGIGYRIARHEQDARNGDTSEKCNIIREIWARGQQVLKIKLAYFDTHLQAELYEASLIASLDGLANISAGRKHIKDALFAKHDWQRFGSTIRQVHPDGSSYWDAREVCDFFGYATWQGFQRVLRRAMKVLASSGEDVSKHFDPTYRIANTEHGGKRSIETYHLSIRAFCLVTMAIDSSTNPVASIGKVWITEMALQYEHLKDGPSDKQAIAF